MKIRVLHSGSGGNAVLVESGGSAVLIDAGVSAELLLRELGAGGHRPQAILLTHEHDDHARGAAALARALEIPVYANEGTHRAAGPLLADAPVEGFTAGRPFRVGALAVEAFPVPHDAAAPVGFALAGNGTRLCVVTDLGEGTDEVYARAAGCDVLLVEANYDLALLGVSPYPWFLKNRILSPTGHLSNDAAARLAAHAAAAGARTIVLLHLSDINNLTSLARDTVRWTLEREGLGAVRIEAVRANAGSPLWAV
ncbi:MAG TPA: MBL fold metallo-hydrolase [bacterium]|nr:MBL fold metallo-hydrolase [bacterium]